MIRHVLSNNHFENKGVKNGMLKFYVAASNRVKDFFADKKGVSHLLEVVGILALAALILVVVFPGARDTITNIWNDLVGNINSTISGS